MIKLTMLNDSVAYVSPENVTTVVLLIPGGGSRLYDGSITPLEVKESPEEVVRLITQSKHRGMVLQSAYSEYFRRFDTRSEIWGVIERIEEEDRV